MRRITKLTDLKIKKRNMRSLDRVRKQYSDYLQFVRSNMASATDIKNPNKDIKTNE